MKTIQKIKSYNAASEKVFACIDDLGVAGMHMTKSSMPMMGGKMDVEFLTAYKSGLHTRYRWTGKVLWRELDFTVEVTKWIKGKEKTWETIGPAKMIIYSWFQMNLKVEQGLHESIAYLSISYNKPKGIFNRILCVLVGPWYAKWCLDNMLNDTEKEIASEQPVHQHLTT